MQDETQVYNPSPVPFRPITPVPPQRRRRGCLGMGLLIGVILFGFTTLCCIGSLTLYILFPPPPFDLIVLGLDARPGEGYATRTDTIMLLGIQPQAMRVSLLSFPRDLFIEAPGYGLKRINTLNVLGESVTVGGGVTLLRDSIQQDFGIDIDSYVRLNFQGFVALIDAVGGVTIDVPKHIVDYSYPTEGGGTMFVEFQPGEQHMDGERALIYARTRHGDDDYQRAARQQQVVSAVIGKLVNPLNWRAAIRVFNEYSDTDMTVWDMIRYAPVMVARAGRFDTLVIAQEYIVPSGNGVVIPNYRALEPWISERFD